MLDMHISIITPMPGNYGRHKEEIAFFLKNLFPVGDPVIPGYIDGNISVIQSGLAESGRWPCVMFSSPRSPSK